MGDFNTPYDDVFRTLLTDCKELIVPIVNEIFKEQYTGKESIVLKENELFLRQQNGQEEKLYQLKETYADIIKRLELLCQRGDINEYVEKTICEMPERVVESLTEKYDNVKKGVT